jgi:copper homeostasis protein
MAYSDHEFKVMRTDAELALESGADGLVFGFLTEQGDIREDHCREFVRLCEQSSAEKPIQTTFHRAFDITRQPSLALEKLIDLGVQRILTSGHAPLVAEALPAIRKLAHRANGRIQIMPGGGIDESNVQKVIRETGLNEFHLYLPTKARDYSALHNPDIYFGSEEKELEYPIVSEQRVREVRNLINELTAR